MLAFRVLSIHQNQTRAFSSPPCRSSAARVGALPLHSAVATRAIIGWPSTPLAWPSQPSMLQHSVAAATSTITSPARPPPAPLTVPSYAACSAVAEPQQHARTARRTTQPSTPLTRSPPRRRVVVAGSPCRSGRRRGGSTSRGDFKRAFIIFS